MPRGRGMTKETKVRMFKMIALGFSTKEISRECKIHPQTVKKYRAQYFREQWDYWTNYILVHARRAGEEHNRMCRELINAAITNEDRITKRQQAEK